MVADLLATGAVVERGQRERTAGRRPVLLELRPEFGYSIGLTLTRTGAAVGLMDFGGRLRREQPVEIVGAPQAAALEQMRRAVRRMRGKAPGHFLGLGVSAPGPVDAAGGTVLNPPNFSLWHGARLAGAFGGLCGAGVFLENNSTALTMAEKAYGRGAECGSFLLVVVTSGIGAGIVRGGEIYRGWRGFGCELGHTSIRQGGRRCNCGLSGCVELYASVPAVVERARKYRPEVTGWHDLADRAEAGDRRCRHLLEEQARALAVAIVNALNTLALEHVVLAGDILYRGEMLRAAVEQHVNEWAIHRQLGRIGVHLSALGEENAELRAAAAIALERFFAGGGLSIPLTMAAGLG
jgi:predicted NBD/HSP70 family sugar kinase